MRPCERCVHYEHAAKSLVYCAVDEVLFHYDDCDEYVRRGKNNVKVEVKEVDILQWNVDTSRVREVRQTDLL